GNPLDAVWSDRPAAPKAPAVAHDIAFAGRSSAETRAEIAAALRRGGADATVLTLSDSICWLLNLRGGDVPRTPFVLSFAVLAADGRVTWLVDPDKVKPALARHLDAEVMVAPPQELGPTLDALGQGKLSVLLDPDWAAAWIFERLRKAGAEIVTGADPCQLPKARKNEIELEGARAAHRRDGLAVSRFLAWLDEEVEALEAGRNEGLSELAVAEKLLGFRKQDKTLRDLSFDTISGAGPNAALPHYRVSEESNRHLAKGEIYLVDSGGQYPDGTTDITRTVAVGPPTPEMRRHFTLVLKGHIALARQRFPRGTTGSQLDALARMHLWQAGLDYDHGTGHGVGS
ncbi:MAG: M24 family metallopeptidase, partial [Geminicoccales bacterium]